MRDELKREGRTEGMDIVHRVGDTGGFWPPSERVILTTASAKVIVEQGEAGQTGIMTVGYKNGLEMGEKTFEAFLPDGTRFVEVSPVGDAPPSSQ